MLNECRFQQCNKICHLKYPSILSGDDGKKGGYDCLLIPSAQTADGEGIATKTGQRPITSKKNAAVEGAFCGAVGLAASRSATVGKTTLKQTVCSKYQ